MVRSRDRPHDQHPRQRPRQPQAPSHSGPRPPLDLATASHPAVRFHEITQSPKDPASERERHWDKAVLESLLVRDSDGQGPLSEQDLRYAFSAKKKKQKLAITDALSRLDGAGLIERRGDRAIVSEVAKSFDQIMTL